MSENNGTLARKPGRSNLVREWKIGGFGKLKGFTLVELIVVITILAILATIGFLALSGYTKDAKDAVVKANVRSVQSVISSESAISGNSPRYYVVHDTWAALSWALVVIDGSPTTLSGGNWNVPGTNYSAGNPDFPKLKINPDKFKTSSIGIFGSFSEVFAAYDPKLLTIGAMDGTTTFTSGKTRTVSYFQVAGVAPVSGVTAVSGNFPTNLSGSVSWLIKDPSSTSSTGALVDGSSAGTSTSGGGSSGGSSPTYPGCDTPDITLSNGQKWAACNAGATTAFVGQTSYQTNAAPSAAQKAWLGAFYQWGRNDDVTTSPTNSTLAPSGATAATAGTTDFILGVAYSWNWITGDNSNLWWGATSSVFYTYADQTAGDKTLMKGPCATWYHVPTQKEWNMAVNSIVGADYTINDSTKYNLVVNTLKLPLPGERGFTGGYDSSWTYGYYWTSSTSGTTYGFFMDVHPSNFNVMSNYTNRGNGFSVRCMAN